MKKNKLAKQLIKKHSLCALYGENSSAIRAILEFSKLAEQHERKAVKAIVKKTDREIDNLFDEIDDIKWDHDDNTYGTGVALMRRKSSNEESMIIKLEEQNENN
jgi:hypothetical protein